MTFNGITALTNSRKGIGFLFSLLATCLLGAFSRIDSTALAIMIPALYASLAGSTAFESRGKVHQDPATLPEGRTLSMFPPEPHDD